MTDEQALLAAICADRAENTPRLVYADWLENDASPLQPERAEFIRVQCKLAQGCPNGNEVCEALGKVGRTDSGCPHCHPFRRRERELVWDFARPHSNWFPEFGDEWTFKLITFSGECQNPSARVSRGFVSALTCSWSDWCTHADAILARQPIERVKYTDWPACDALNEVSGGHAGNGRYPILHYSSQQLAETHLPCQFSDHAGKVTMHLEGRQRWHELGMNGRTESVNSLLPRLLAAEWPGIEFELPPPDVVIGPTFQVMNAT